jgi:hypothetical protein
MSFAHLAIGGSTTTFRCELGASSIVRHTRLFMKRGASARDVVKISEAFADQRKEFFGISLKLHRLN